MEIEHRIDDKTQIPYGYLRWRTRDEEKYRRIFPNGEFIMDFLGKKLSNRKVDWGKHRVSVPSMKELDEKDILVISKFSDGTVVVRKKSVILSSRKIEIDEEVWQFLKKNAEPFKDTPNDVLRRLLLKKGNRSFGLTDETHPTISPRKTKNPAHLKISTEQLRYSIIKVLLQFEEGGSDREEIMNILYKKHKDIFSQAYYQEKDSTGVRWKHAIDSERARMVKDGLIAKNTPKGIWGLTQKGGEWYEEESERS